MYEQVGGIEGGCEEPLVALELQFIRHHVIGVCQHAVRRHDDIAVDTQSRHAGQAGAAYCDTSVTTLDTGRWLSVGSLASFTNCSSYCGRLFTGALARIATTLYPSVFNRFRMSGRSAAVSLWKSCIRMMPLPFFSSPLKMRFMTFFGSWYLKSKESTSHEKIAM